VFWYTKEDNAALPEVSKRITHYSLLKKCSPRIRAWKAKVTNTRVFNHNLLDGERFPQFFNLRHYPIRSEEHLLKRLKKDRANLEKDGSNVHYNAMENNLNYILQIKPEILHVDDGVKELNQIPFFNWDVVYGETVKNDAQAENEALRKQIESIINSTSWKVTKPLRFIKRLLKRKG
jgi:hypothetical protein